MSSPRQSSSLLKAASVPDFSSLPSPAPSPPTIPLPPPQLGPVMRMLEDAETYTLSRPAISHTQITIPRPSPPLSPSPARSPRINSPRASSPRASPSATYHAPPSAVSFSEYVTDELACDQEAQEKYGVSFVPARQERADMSQSIQAPTADPFDSDNSSKRILETSRPDAIELPRSETLPALCEIISPNVLESESVEPTADPEDAHEPFVFTGKGRYGKLDCIELDEKGLFEERQLSRADILNEARATLSETQPSPKAVGKWLTDNVPIPSPHAAQFEPFAAGSRKAAQKAMRDYLRNSLQARDIRQVDPAFAARPALWVRHSAIVVSLEGLRAIILHSKMFLFDPGKERTKHLLFIAQQSVLARPDAENPQPFEFRALEGILIFLAMGLESEFEALKPEIDLYLHQLPNQLNTKMLEELRSKKQQLNHFHSRANSVKTILEGVLDEDEDMANMYLTEKHMSRNYVRDAVDHNEVETLLEAYLQVIDEHVNHAALLNDAIDDTEDLVSIHLDTLRNRLLSIDLVLSVVSMTFSFGGVVAGVFGMNVRIGLFDATASHKWFIGVVVSIFLSVIVGSCIMLYFLRRRGLYSFY